MAHQRLEMDTPPLALHHTTPTPLPTPRVPLTFLPAHRTRGTSMRPSRSTLGSPPFGPFLPWRLPYHNKCNISPTYHHTNPQARGRQDDDPHDRPPAPHMPQPPFARRAVSLFVTTTTMTLLLLLRRLSLTGAFVVPQPRRGLSTSSSSFSSLARARSSASVFAPDRRRRVGVASTRLFAAATSAAVDSLKQAIGAKGDEIRALKGSGADKAALQPLITELLGLKKQYEEAAGEPFDSPKSGGGGGGGKKKASGGGGGGPAAKKAKVSDDDEGTMKQHMDRASLVITPRDENYSQWYLDVIAAADLVDQSPVKGCMVIKPYGMALWDALREDLDKRIKASGAQNAYFPLFIPRSFLSKEAEHVEGFAKECAVVTHHRLCADPSGAPGLIPDPDAKLEEPLVVRPTSETIIWNMFSKWIGSHRDLPLKINQWANVVRWEMRTRPFLRSSEFLWQEGHTAHATQAEALGYARDQLELYATVCEEMLALPVVKGVKSATERFAGADETFTIEALMQNGWALQSGTSHFLGQNFARAFDVFFQTAEGTRELVWATSWGVSTRLIGALVMTHSDDKGLVLPPSVAPIQVVVVPILKGEKDAAENDATNAFVNTVVSSLRTQGVRVHVDDRPNMRPGAKYFEWERKGVPLRLEIGQRDASAGAVTLARRTGGEKETVPAGNSFGHVIRKELEACQSSLMTQAAERVAAHTYRVDTYAEMKQRLVEGGREEIGFFLAPWKDDVKNEAAIKEDCRATIRCYPLDLNGDPGMVASRKCFYSGEPATHIALFARAF